MGVRIGYLSFVGSPLYQKKIYMCVCVSKGTYTTVWGAVTSSKLDGSSGERCAEGSDRAEGEIENILKSAHPEFQVDVA